MAQNISPLFNKVNKRAFLTHAEITNNLAYMRFGERLKHARNERGLTQAELSQRSGVSQPLISQLEKSLTATGSEYTNRLAKALHINPDWLADEQGEMERVSYETHDPKIIAALKVMESMPDYALDEAIKSVASIKKLSERATGSGGKTGTED